MITNMSRNLINYNHHIHIVGKDTNPTQQNSTEKVMLKENQQQPWILH